MLINKIKEAINKIGKDMGALRAHYSYTFKSIPTSTNISNDEGSINYTGVLKNRKVLSEKYILNDLKRDERIFIVCSPPKEYFSTNVNFNFKTINVKLTSSELPGFNQTIVINPIEYSQDTIFFEIKPNYDSINSLITTLYNINIQLELLSGTKDVIIPDITIHLDNRKIINNLVGYIDKVKLDLLSKINSIQSIKPGKHGTSISEDPIKHGDLSTPIQGLAYFDSTSINRPSNVNNGVLASFSKTNTNDISNNLITELSFGDNNILNFRQWNNGQDSGWHEILTSRTLPSRTISVNGVSSGKNIVENGVTYASTYNKQWYTLRTTIMPRNQIRHVAHKFPDYKKITSIQYRVDGASTSYFSGFEISATSTTISIKNISTATELQNPRNIPIIVYVEYEV